MKEGFDPGKWICAYADDVKVAGYGDVILYIMLDSNSGLLADNFVNAFREICNAELDFEI